MLTRKYLILCTVMIPTSLILFIPGLDDIVELLTNDFSHQGISAVQYIAIFLLTPMFIFAVSVIGLSFTKLSRNKIIIISSYLVIALPFSTSPFFISFPIWSVIEIVLGGGGGFH